MAPSNPFASLGKSFPSTTTPSPFARAASPFATSTGSDPTSGRTELNSTQNLAATSSPFSQLQKPTTSSFGFGTTPANTETSTSAPAHGANGTEEMTRRKQDKGAGKKLPTAANNPFGKAKTNGSLARNAEKKQPDKTRLTNSKPDAARPRSPTTKYPKAENEYAKTIYKALSDAGCFPPMWPKDRKQWEPFRETYKEYREEARKVLWKHDLIDNPEKRRKLEDALDFKGICEEMCPDFETITRMVQRDIKKEECGRDENGTLQPDRARFVKKMARAAAGQEEPLPMDVRSIASLKASLIYLIQDVLGTDENTLPAVHNFLWDRMRAIRRDFVYHSKKSDEELLVQVWCLETMTRFHVTANHLLSRKGFAKDDFVQQQETEQLGKTLLSLTQTYDDCNDRGIECENEGEFRAYSTLFNCHQPNFQQKAYEAQSESWFRSTEAQFAFQLIEMMESPDRHTTLKQPVLTVITGNSPLEYMRAVEETPITYTMACFAEIHMIVVRETMLINICKTYAKAKKPPKDLTAEVMRRMLCFDHQDEAVRFLEDHGLHFTSQNANHEYLLLRKGFRPARTDRKHYYSQRLVESKRAGRNMVDVILSSGPTVATKHVESEEQVEDSMFVTQVEEANGTDAEDPQSDSSTEQDPQTKSSAMPPKETPSSFSAFQPSSLATSQAPTSEAFAKPVSTWGQPAAQATTQASAAPASSWSAFKPSTQPTAQVDAPPAAQASSPFALATKPAAQSASPFASLLKPAASTSSSSTSVVQPAAQASSPFSSAFQSAVPQGQDKTSTQAPSPFASAFKSGPQTSSPFSTATQPSTQNSAQPSTQTSSSPFTPAASSPFTQSASTSSFTSAGSPFQQSNKSEAGNKEEAPANASPFATATTNGAKQMFPGQQPTTTAAPPAWLASAAKDTSSETASSQPVTNASPAAVQHPLAASNKVLGSVMFGPTAFGPEATAPPSVQVTSPTPEPPSSTLTEPAAATATAFTPAPFVSTTTFKPAASSPLAPASNLTQTAPPIAPSAKPVSKKDALDGLTRWFVHGDGGVMQDFTYQVAESICQVAFEQHKREEAERIRKEEDEKSWADAMKFRHYNLGLKFFYRWRNNARESALNRRARNARDSMKAYQAERLKERRAARKRAAEEEASSNASSQRDSATQTPSLSEYRASKRRRQSQESEAEAELLSSGIFNGVRNEQRAVASAVGRVLSPSSTGSATPPSPAKPPKPFPVPVTKRGLLSKSVSMVKDLANGDHRRSTSASFRNSLPARNPSVRSMSPADRITNFSRSVKEGSRRSMLKPSHAKYGTGSRSAYWKMRIMGMIQMPNKEYLHESLAIPLLNGKRLPGLGTYGVESLKAASTPELVNGRKVNIDGIAGKAGSPAGSSPVNKRKRDEEEEDDDADEPAKKRKSIDEDLEEMKRTLREFNETCDQLDEGKEWMKETREKMQEGFNPWE